MSQPALIINETKDDEIPELLSPAAQRIKQMQETTNYPIIHAVASLAKDVAFVAAFGGFIVEAAQQAMAANTNTVSNSLSSVSANEPRDPTPLEIFLGSFGLQIAIGASVLTYTSKKIGAKKANAFEAVFATIFGLQKLIPAESLLFIPFYYLNPAAGFFGLFTTMVLTNKWISLDGLAAWLGLLPGVGAGLNQFVVNLPPEGRAVCLAGGVLAGGILTVKDTVNFFKFRDAAKHAAHVAEHKHLERTSTTDTSISAIPDNVDPASSDTGNERQALLQHGMEIDPGCGCPIC